MLIAVNGKSLFIKHKGGAVRVALNVIEHIAAARPDIFFDLFVPIGCESSSAVTKLPDNVRVRITRSRLFANSVLKSMGWEQMILPFIVRKGSYSLLFNPTNSAPVLMDPGIPQVLLLHDAGFRNRQWFSDFFSRYVDWVVRRAVKRDINIVTVSQTASEEIQKVYPDIKITGVIPNAVDNQYSAVEPKDTGYRYILFIGSLNPRKNLKGAVEGFRIFKSESIEDIRLVIIGSDKAIFVKNGANANRSDDVILLGYVDDKEKWAWIKGAEMLMFPSFLEGFGIPILEAMSVGTPVVASGIQPFYELFGDALYYVNPYQPQDIARGISEVLHNRDLRDTIAKRGCQRAAFFSWKRAANEYIQLFEKVAGQ
jgi:glycosyltransferase involved in cell wall biosynthesis